MEHQNGNGRGPKKSNAYLGVSIPYDVDHNLREINFRIEQASGQKIGLSLMVSVALQDLMKRPDLHDYMLEQKLEKFRDKVLVA